MNKTFVVCPLKPGAGGASEDAADTFRYLIAGYRLVAIAADQPASSAGRPLHVI
jgi:hypothetical protein